MYVQIEDYLVFQIYVWMYNLNIWEECSVIKLYEDSNCKYWIKIYCWLSMPKHLLQMITVIDSRIFHEYWTELQVSMFLVPNKF